ncbi:MAG: LysE family translocator [Parasphingorhabdus sp.]
MVSFSLLAAPGPISLLIVSCTLSFGRNRAAAIIPGSILGDFVTMSLSLVGAGIVVTKYPFLFDFLKFGGAIILFVIGFSTFAKARKKIYMGGAFERATASSLFLKGFVLSALHPSGFVFFTAFAPQFIEPSGSFMKQAALLIITFLSIAGLTGFIWLFGASYIRKMVVQTGVLRNFQKFNGLLLMGFSVILMILLMIS